MSIQPRGNELVGGKLIQGGFPADLQFIRFNFANDQWEFITQPAGEVNTGANVGAGSGNVFRDKVGVVLNFKTLLQGTNIVITDNADDITIETLAEINLAANVGGGAGNVFRDKTGVTLNLKTLLAGTNITVTDNADDITLATLAEINLAANVGGGAGTVFRDKTGVTLNLKTLLAGANITITNNANDITIAASGGGGGSVSGFLFLAQQMFDGNMLKAEGSLAGASGVVTSITPANLKTFYPCTADGAGEGNAGDKRPLQLRNNTVVIMEILFANAVSNEIQHDDFQISGGDSLEGTGALVYDINSPNGDAVTTFQANLMGFIEDTGTRPS